MKHDDRSGRAMALRDGDATVRRAWVALAILAGVLLSTGCSATASRQLPQRPALPAVKFVPPCDEQATVALTAEGVESLKARDAAWRAYVERLEAVIGSDRSAR